jgi:hypothetical protein
MLWLVFRHLPSPISDGNVPRPFLGPMVVAWTITITVTSRYREQVPTLRKLLHAVGNDGTLLEADYEKTSSGELPVTVR